MIRQRTYAIFEFSTRRCPAWFGKHLTLTLAVCWLCGTGSAQQTQVLLDLNATGRVFDGLGAVSTGASSRLLIDYPEPQRSEILDYLFKPDYGTALQRLKGEVGADLSSSSDWSEPR